jgi:hypothetical protein
MATYQTTKQISPKKLADELGVPVTIRGTSPDEIGSKTVEAETTVGALGTAVTNHVYDDEYELSEKDRQIRRVRALAQDVLAGTDTFTNAQIQKLVAALVLRETG